METILKNLYNQYGIQQNVYNKERNQISENEKNLKKSLSDDMRILLLRIHDDYDFIVLKTAEDCFINGLLVGTKLMMELLYNNQ